MKFVGYLWRSQGLKLYRSFYYSLILSGLLKECLFFYPTSWSSRFSILNSTDTCLLLRSLSGSTHQIERGSWGSVHGWYHWWLESFESTWVGTLEVAACCNKTLLTGTQSWLHHWFAHASDLMPLHLI